MLTYAMPAVLAATEHAQRLSPEGLIGLTCNKIHHLFNRLILEPAHRIPNPPTWPTGGNTTNTAPAPATTNADPRHDHELELEY